MPQPHSPQEKKHQRIKEVAKYSGIALQLFGGCLLGALGGRYIDNWLGMERPTFAVFLTLFFMIAVLYAIYRQLLRG